MSREFRKMPEPLVKILIGMMNAVYFLMRRRLEKELAAIVNINVHDVPDEIDGDDRLLGELEDREKRLFVVATRRAVPTIGIVALRIAAGKALQDSLTARFPYATDYTIRKGWKVCEMKVIEAD